MTFGTASQQDKWQPYRSTKHRGAAKPHDTGYVTPPQPRLTPNTAGKTDSVQAVTRAQDSRKQESGKSFLGAFDQRV